MRRFISRISTFIAPIDTFTVATDNSASYQYIILYSWWKQAMVAYWGHGSWHNIGVLYLFIRGKHNYSAETLATMLMQLNS